MHLRVAYIEHIQSTVCGCYIASRMKRRLSVYAFKFVTCRG